MPRRSNHLSEAHNLPSDAHLLFKLRELLGLTQSKLAEASGLTLSTVHKLEQKGLGKTTRQTKVNIARAFLKSDRCSTVDSKVLLDHLENLFDRVIIRAAYAGDNNGVNQFSNTNWIRARWPASGYESVLVDLLDKAELVLSCTKGLDSYLLPSKMNESFWEIKLQREGFSEDTKKRMWNSHMRFTKETLDMRKNRPFKHRLLVSSEFLQNQSDADRTGIRDNFRDYNRVVEPSIAEPDAWDRITNIISNEYQLYSWHKLLVIDEKIAVLWHQQENWEYTQDPMEVRTMKNLLNATLNAFAAEKFDGREEKRIRSLLG